jgi:predicted permease
MRIYRALLHLYPAAFRGEYGTEMAAIFASRRRRASGMGVLALWLETLVDVATGAAAVHAEILGSDLRQAARSLRRSPGFALTAIPLVALGIGANTAAFSVADFVLLRPLPYADSGRLVQVSESVPGYRVLEPSPANYRDWHRLATCFSSMGAATSGAVNMVGQGDPQRVQGAWLTADLFSTLGVRPLLGRLFTAAEDRAGMAGTLVLSYPLWQAEFGGDRRVLGRRLLLDGEPFEVIGVMPRGFSYPNREARMWMPMRFTADAFQDRNNYYLDVVARLRPGVSLGRARAEMTVVAAQLERQYPKENAHAGAVVNLLRDDISDSSRLLVLALCGAALCVLLIACANLANLLLARALARQQELDVRAALGAGREQLVRQLATESLALAFLGGLLGVAAAHAALPLFTRLVPSALPIAGAPAIDLRVLAFAALLTAVTGFAFGMLPAWRAGRAAGFAGLRQGARTGGGRRGRLRGALVVAEVTVSVVLLVSSGLLLRALWRLRDVDPGFRAAGVVTLRTELPMPAYAATARRTAFYARVLAGARSLPGVAGAAYTTAVPMAWRGGIWQVRVAGRPIDAAGGDEAILRFATPGLFATLAIPILRGRDIREADTTAAPFVAIVSDSFARRYWPDQEPLGRHFRFAFHDRTVAGVVGDVRARGVERTSEPQVYIPYQQAPDAELTYYAPKDLAVRTASDPLALLPALRRIVRDADPQQAIDSQRTLAEVVADETAPRAVQLRALVAFAAVAFLLAAIGIHGLLAFAVSQRAGEIGVRMALGARASDILSMVATQGALLGLAGVVPGLALAYAAARAMAAILAGVAPGDWRTYAAAVGLCLLMTATGSLLPAQRAAHIDPAIVIRRE